MLSKEEIEKAKGWLSALDIKSEFEAISKEIISQYIEQLENQIEVKEMEHKYDVNMIDEVKREAVKLYKEIRKQNKIIDEMAEQLSGLPILDIEKAEYITLGNKEETKQYFERKVDKDE